jgi:hypothetical protein
MAEVALHCERVEHGDSRRAERVAQVVQPDPAQPGPLDRPVEPSPHRPPVQSTAKETREDGVVVVGEVLAPLSRASASTTRGVIGTDRTRFPFGTFSRGGLPV